MTDVAFSLGTLVIFIDPIGQYLCILDKSLPPINMIIEIVDILELAAQLLWNHLDGHIRSEHGDVLELVLQITQSSLNFLHLCLVCFLIVYSPDDFHISFAINQRT